MEEEEEEKEEEESTKRKNNLGVGLMRGVTFITQKLIKTFAAPKVLRMPACLVEGGLARGQKSLKGEDVMGNGMLVYDIEGRGSAAAAFALNVSVDIGRAAL